MEPTLFIFNKCNCMKKVNTDFNSVGDYQHKRTLGSFLPMCDKCLSGDVEVKYRLTYSDVKLSIGEINEICKMLTFISKKNFIRIQATYNMKNAHVTKWILNLKGEESFEPKIIKSAKDIDLLLADIFNMPVKKNQLPCNIELVFKNPSDKSIIHKTYLSYQFCEFFYSI